MNSDAEEKVQLSILSPHGLMNCENLKLLCNIVFPTTWMSVVSDVDDCLSGPCMNGGTCKDELNGYNCSCVVGYSGDNCETGKYNLYGAIIMP